MPKIHIASYEEEIEAAASENMLALLTRAGYEIEQPCNGKGICGKCKIKTDGAKLPVPSREERRFLSDAELASGVRLACYLVASEDMTVTLMQKEKDNQNLTEGYLPDFSFAPAISKRIFSVPASTLDKQEPYRVLLAKALEEKEIPWDVLQGFRYTKKALSAVFLNEELIAIEDEADYEERYGLALDVGTTTVVLSLIDLNTGKERANTSMINAQKKYGLDVLTRISYVMEHPDTGVQDLQATLIESVNELIAALCEETGAEREHIYELVISANTTMMHTFLGIDISTIGRSPYAPMFTNSFDVRAKDIGLRIADCGRVLCLPGVSSYIGPDIVSGTYVCELQKSTGTVLFIDIGTNGEIVLASDGKLTSCSCAAGPALEGMNISCGMRAAYGAVEDVQITPEGVKLATIGNTEPIGICGSGILAVISELVRTGIIKKSGVFVKPDQLADDDWRRAFLRLDGKKRSFVLYESNERTLCITQDDVRQVQLAKGAILSGFRTLLKESGLTEADPDEVVIAGQFGAHLKSEHLVGAGLLPPEVVDRIRYVGNSSKSGAVMALLSTQVRCEMDQLSHHMDYLELGVTENYERVFTDCLMFR